MQTNLIVQIQSAAERAARQGSNNEPIFLLEENRCGEYMGKPGDVKNPYYIHWFEFYSLDKNSVVKYEKTALRFPWTLLRYLAETVSVKSMPSKPSEKHIRITLSFC